MARQVSKLSIEEIRARYVQGDQPVTAQLLASLRRDSRQGVRRIYDSLRKRFEAERDVRLRLDAMLNFERVLWRSGVQRIAGVDEVGMGPLAGPVVAAAVVFPPGTELEGIDDSKRLEPGQRAELAREIRAAASGIGVGRVEVEEIDRLNIYQAGLLAMRRAIEGLPEPPEHVLVDARTIPELDLPQNAFSKGDGINYSIAAASIVAKTHRDALMVELDAAYPGYGFAQHKGYGTREHQEAIRSMGPCAIHRRSFTFLRELRGEYSGLFYELKERLPAIGDNGGLAAFEAELQTLRGELGEVEHRKLRVMLGRRWR